MKRIILVLTFFMNFSFSQQSGWSAPVLIDSVRDIGEPLIAVSNKGQIAILGNVSRSPSPLYISNDNGKSFQLQSQFTPDKPIYRFGYPNGLSYDSDGNIWVYWVWHECIDSECYFFRNTWIYISRSSDSGMTFEHILKLKGGYNTMTTFRHSQWLQIGADNSIHFLRDTMWFNPSKNRTEYQLIYTKLHADEGLVQEDYFIPMVSDTSRVSYIHGFVLPGDSLPIVAFGVSTYSSPITDFIYYAKFRNNNEFSINNDSTLYNLILGKDGNIYATSFFYDQNFNFIGSYIRKSTDHGVSYSQLQNISTSAYFIQTADSIHQHSLQWTNPSRSFRYYKFQELTSVPIETTYLGSFSYGRMVLDDLGGKYIVARGTDHRCYLIGRDIITKLYTDETIIKTNELKVSLSPNPFNNSTILSFHLPKNSLVNILIYDAIGREIKSINNYEAKEGLNKISISGATLASGTYLIGILYENRLFTVKSQLVK